MEDMEDIYDEQIAPLMAQIIAICKEYSLPMAATFQYGPDDGEGALLCTTVIDPEGSCETIGRCRKVMYEGYGVTPPFQAFVVRTEPP